MRTIEVPDHLAEHLLSRTEAARKAEKRLLDALIADLRSSWERLTYTARGRRIRTILESYPETAKGWLSKQIGVSHPVAGYHYRFTFLTQQQQDDLDAGVLLVPDAIPLASAAYAAATGAAPPPPAPPQVSEILNKAEDLDCPQEVVVPVENMVHHSSDSRFEPGLPGFTEVHVYQDDLEEREPAADFDKEYSAFRDWIGWNGEPKPCSQRPPGDIIKSIVLNDTHIPFMCDESFRKMIHEEAADTDQLILAGDIATMSNFTHFPKFSRTYTPAEGFLETSKFMAFCNEAFPSVKVFPGNHDNRFIKWLVKDRGIPPDVLEYFELLSPGFCDPLKIICKDLANVEVLAPIEYEKAKFAFLYQFGDFVVGHAETYSKIPLRAGTNFSHWLKSFAEPIGIVGKRSPAGCDIRCVGQAHTHQAGKVFSDYGIWSFELGCMSQMEEYTGSPRIMSARPWVKGYTVVYQDRETGRTDINRSHFIHTGDF
jgi:hypothetical protein